MKGSWFMVVGEGFCSYALEMESIKGLASVDLGMCLPSRGSASVASVDTFELLEEIDVARDIG